MRSKDRVAVIWGESGKWQRTMLIVCAASMLLNLLPILLIGLPLYDLFRSIGWAALAFQFAFISVDAVRGFFMWKGFMKENDKLMADLDKMNEQIKEWQRETMGRSNLGRRSGSPHVHRDYHENN